MGAPQQALMAVVAAATYTANAVDFDGTNDYLKKLTDFTGNADSKTGIFSAWARFDAGDSTTLEMLNNLTNPVNIFRNSANKFNFNFTSTAGASSFIYKSVASYTAGATWYNVLSSWDTNHAAGAKVAQLYINDVSDCTVTLDADAAFDIAYASTTWSLATNVNSLGTSNFNGCLSEIYFAPGQYLDFSSSSNRRKFISATGKPVNLGTDGSTPTGTAPILYLKNAFGTVGTNSGTGGNMTIIGAPAACSTSPSS